MNIEFLLAEADMAIERNQAMTSGKGKYRADHHADLATICTLLRNELKELKGQAKSGTKNYSHAENHDRKDNLEQEYAGLDVGIIRASYRARASR
ncbi:MAG: hypothetical protein V4628_13825 [Pseudomonadota bacterium]